MRHTARRRNDKSTPRGAFLRQSRQVLPRNSASRGISSRRPMSISSDSTSLLRGERMEKFSMGPRMPRPGPTLLIQVSDAAKDSSAEHDAAVGDGFVSRNGQFAPERRCMGKFH